MICHCSSLFSILQIIWYLSFDIDWPLVPLIAKEPIIKRNSYKPILISKIRRHMFSGNLQDGLLKAWLGFLSVFKLRICSFYTTSLAERTWHLLFDAWWISKMGAGCFSGVWRRWSGSKTGEIYLLAFSSILSTPHSRLWLKTLRSERIRRTVCGIIASYSNPLWDQFKETWYRMTTTIKLQCVLFVYGQVIFCGGCKIPCALDNITFQWSQRRSFKHAHTHNLLDTTLKSKALRHVDFTSTHIRDQMCMYFCDMYIEWEETALMLHMFFVFSSLPLMVHARQAHTNSKITTYSCDGQSHPHNGQVPKGTIDFCNEH